MAGRFVSALRHTGVATRPSLPAASSSTIRFVRSSRQFGTSGHVGAASTAAVAPLHAHRRVVLHARSRHNAAADSAIVERKLETTARSIVGLGLRLPLSSPSSSGARSSNARIPMHGLSLSNSNTVSPYERQKMSSPSPPPQPQPQLQPWLQCGAFVGTPMTRDMVNARAGVAASQNSMSSTVASVGMYNVNVNAPDAHYTPALQLAVERNALVVCGSSKGTNKHRGQGPKNFVGKMRRRLRRAGQRKQKKRFAYINYRICMYCASPYKPHHMCLSCGKTYNNRHVAEGNAPVV